MDRDIEVLISQPGIGFRAFIDDEFVAMAPLRFDVASWTASAIGDVLPQGAPVTQVTCSGEGVFFYDGDAEFERRLREHESGVADLLAAYEAAEVPYFAAVAASTPAVQQLVASDSAEPVPIAEGR